MNFVRLLRITLRSSKLITHYNISVVLKSFTKISMGVRTPQMLNNVYHDKTQRHYGGLSPVDSRSHETPPTRYLDSAQRRPYPFRSVPSAATWTSKETYEVTRYQLRCHSWFVSRACTNRQVERRGRHLSLPCGWLCIAPQRGGPKKEATYRFIIKYY